MSVIQRNVVLIAQATCCRIHQSMLQSRQLEDNFGSIAMMLITVRMMIALP
ncbi:hypothetical protein J6500_26920 [Bradyrhizobium sp. WSM 1704]|uniref:hypothetical protein n=1 Tax=Bradyrhizobium semiaridum TaxID=2821404 RepID=UPI001CE2B9E1|nr:hypothetical protein [Bradyrhizobium semiaridum]MCA6125501.1 hypothetical protein [Bradyrhizobium semiaridum]